MALKSDYSREVSPSDLVFFGSLIPEGANSLGSMPTNIRVKTERGTLFLGGLKVKPSLYAGLFATLS